MSSLNHFSLRDKKTWSEHIESRWDSGLPATLDLKYNTYIETYDFGKIHREKIVHESVVF